MKLSRYRLLYIKHLINNSDYWANSGANSRADFKAEDNKLNISVVLAGAVWTIIIPEGPKLLKLIVILLILLTNLSDWPELGIKYRLLFNLVFFGSDSGVPGIPWLPELPKLPAGVVTSVLLLLLRILILLALSDLLFKLRLKICGLFLIII